MRVYVFTSPLLEHLCPIGKVCVFLFRCEYVDRRSYTHNLHARSGLLLCLSSRNDTRDSSITQRMNEKEQKKKGDWRSDTRLFSIASQRLAG